MVRRVLLTLAALLSLAAGSPGEEANPAGPSLKAFFPAGGQRGTRVEVSLIGSFPNWPVETWTNSAGLQVESVAGDERALSVTIDESARPGVHWIRVCDAYGASMLRPFVVETVQEKLESDFSDTEIPLADPVIINGRLEKKNEVDTYRLSLAKDQLVAISINAHEHVGSPMDCVMQIFDPKHEVVVAQTDDSPRRDPKLVYSASRAGEYEVRLFAFPATPNQTIGFAGAEDFVYRLTVSTSGIVRRAAPLLIGPALTGKHDSNPLQLAGDLLPARSAEVVAHHDGQFATAFADRVPGWFDVEIVDATPMQEAHDGEPNAPFPLKFGSRVSGTIAVDGEVDIYSIDLAKGDRIRVRATSRSLGFPLDPVLEIQSTDGGRLARNDDAAGNAMDPRDATVALTAKTDGRHLVRISDLHGRGGDEFAYLLSIDRDEPDFGLEAKSETWKTAASETLEIPIEIKRSADFKEDISVVVTGIPGHVTVSGGLSIAGSDTEKALTLRIRGEEAFSGPIQIVGLSGLTPLARKTTCPSVLPGVQTDRFWLTIQPRPVEPETASEPTQK